MKFNMMLFKLISFLIFLLTLSLAPATVAETEASFDIIGDAYDRKKGNLLYTENHHCEAQSQQCTVEYRDEQGTTFAKKEIDYSASLQAPSVVLTDYRNDSTVEIATGDRSDLVVDAGFDNFVRSVWSQLEAGTEVKFPFLVVGFDDPIGMTALRTESDTCTDMELCLEVNLDSWFLRLLVAPIELSYSLQNKRLLRFSGTSNIKGDEGKSLNVDILYRYSNKLPLSDLDQQSQN
ncbi:MAG: hypothetical protein ACJAYC_000706 [Halieaceae bacterium]